MKLTEKLIDWAERGRLPDAVLRMGIRRLLKNRLKQVDLGSPEANQLHLKQLIREFDQGPIAPVPEKANQQHYEVPADVYRYMLGQRRKYSCCYWSDDVKTLDQAEVAALRMTCQRAGISDGMKVLELGCGWGSLTLWMAEQFPTAQITAVSNSASQREFILNRARETGIDANLQVITCDMNDFDIDQQFDRVVSVEMFEHMRNYRRLMHQISKWLVPDGKLFVHIFCHRDLTYEFQDRSSSDWMSRYFFTGGIMPSDDLLLQFQSDLSIQQQWRWSGLHYEKTANAWIRNMDLNRDALMVGLAGAYPAHEAKRWFYRWRMFYMACAELFGYDQGNQWWVSHYLFSNTRVLPSAKRLPIRLVSSD